MRRLNEPAPTPPSSPRLNAASALFLKTYRGSLRYRTNLLWQVRGRYLDTQTGQKKHLNGSVFIYPYISLLVW
jgi:hypothetical protein